MKSKGITLLEPGPGRDALKRRCRDNKISISIIEQLVEAELDQVGKKVKRGLHERFDEILSAVEDDAPAR
ncbi:MAG: hypothetical protein Q8N23_28265 [Archangium sp.]|nr:hypothetical protein [Archangium sp.]MDP3576300.1 hypothetical protein [Archangium sp.]